MVTNEQKRTVERIGEIIEAKFGMDEEDLAHVFNIMRKQTYSDEILAVCREYSVNARDAGVEVGSDRPMEVTLPTLDDMNWTCRDFGPGMDFDTIKRIYTRYGKSTKRGTNAQTGMLGIGSKSAFAYGDEFSIVSYKDGVKYTCSAYIDETQIGIVALLGTNPTEEPNGMEIIVPVRQQDMGAFCRKTAQVFRYLDVTPVLKGREGENWMEEHGGKRDAFIDGKDWRYIGDQDQSVAIMGGIAYRINTHSLDNLPQDIERLINAGVEMTFDVGSLSFAASREDLKYDEKTQALVMDRLKMIHNSILDLIEGDFEACESLWDAQILYHNLFSLNGELAAIGSIVKGNVFWTKKYSYWVGDKKFLVDDATYSFGGWDRWSCGSCRLHKYTFDADGLPMKKEQVKSMSPSKDSIFLVQDGFSKAGEKAKVYSLGSKGHKTVYALSVKNDDVSCVRVEFFKKYNVVDGGIPHVLHSKAERLKLPSTSGGYVGSDGSWKRDNHDNRREFILNDVASSDGFYKNSWDIEDDVDMKHGSGIYVEIRRFEAGQYGEFDINPGSLQYKINKLRETIGEDIELYGFKPSSVKKLGKGWVPLWEHLIKVGKAAVAEMAEEYVRGRVNDRALYSTSVNGQDYFKPEELPAGSMRDYLVARNSLNCNSEVYTKMLKVVQVCNVASPDYYDDSLTPDINLQALGLRAEKHYPLLPSINISYKNKQDAIRYIEMVEQTA